MYIYTHIRYIYMYIINIYLHVIHKYICVHIYTPILVSEEAILFLPKANHNNLTLAIFVCLHFSLVCW